MESPEQRISGSKRFGSYLRQVREGKNLSLDAVEEMSSGFPERVTKSHLSRVENGLALPSFPRLFALARIYGLTVSALAERFDVEFQKEQLRVDLSGKSPKELLHEARRLSFSGRIAEALAIYTALRETTAEAGDGPEVPRKRIGLALRQIECLVHLARYELGRNEAEAIMSQPEASPEQKREALQHFVVCCYRTKRFTVAMMGLERAESEMASLEGPVRMRADLAMIRGNILTTTGQPDLAVKWYEAAQKIYDELEIPFEACRTKLNLGAALIEIGERNRAARIVRSALEVADRSGYDRLRALGLSHLAKISFLDDDLDASESYCIRSNTIARPRDYVSVVFRNCYYLRNIAESRGDASGVKANERTLRVYLSRVDDSVREADEFRAVLRRMES